MTVHVLTANDLLSGEPVFRGGAAWRVRWAEADVFAEPAPAEAALAAARAEPTVVVEPYLVDCTLEGAMAVPVSYRERVRALGPTIHPEMGKQAEGGDAVVALQSATGHGRASSGRLGLIARKK